MTFLIFQPLYTILQFSNLYISFTVNYGKDNIDSRNNRSVA